MPSHSSHKLQPCDVAVFGPLKEYYHEQVARLERGGVNTIGKQHFTYLYSPAREKAFTKRNILAAWRGSGLFPFNPNRVLTNIPKPPPIELSITINNETTEPQYEALPTPATPKSGEALTLLLNMIEHVPNDDAGSQRKERLQQKVSHAAQTFLAQNALLYHQNKFLLKINDESKPRRATKSIKLGDARAITFEDLEQARAAHAENAAKKAAKAATGATTGKKKRGRPQKNATAEISEPNAAEAATEATTGKKRGRPRKNATAEMSEPKAKVARISGNEIADGEAGHSEAKVADLMPKPWRAPEAKMW